MEKDQIKNKRTLTGIIVSDKMDKTVVVQILRLKKHPKLRKYFKITTRYKVDDPENKYQTGDKVIIQESKPISRWKRWVVVGKVNQIKD